MTSRKVLVVDKKEDCRTMLMNIFESSGYIVLEAEDGKQAIELLVNWRETSEIDLIIFNIQMPKADEVETIKFIIGQFPKISIILISEHIDSVIFSPFKNMGGKITFAKPYEIKKFSGVENSCF